jgi:hypothetical protein
MWYVTIKNRNVFTILLLDLCKLNKCVHVWYLQLNIYKLCWFLRLMFLRGGGVNDWINCLYSQSVREQVDIV